MQQKNVQSSRFRDLRSPLERTVRICVYAPNVIREFLDIVIGIHRFNAFVALFVRSENQKSACKQAAMKS